MSNRPPSLMKYQMGKINIVNLDDMEFYAPETIIPKWLFEQQDDKFKLNVLFCGPYNADFDGDELNIFVSNSIVEMLEEEQSDYNGKLKL